MDSTSIYLHIESASRMIEIVRKYTVEFLWGIQVMRDPEYIPLVLYYATVPSPLPPIVFVDDVDDRRRRLDTPA